MSTVQIFYRGLSTWGNSKQKESLIMPLSTIHHISKDVGEELVTLATSGPFHRSTRQSVHSLFSCRAIVSCVTSGDA
jgi:hypothetical protein